jgi:hypothetical protein
VWTYNGRVYKSCLSLDHHESLNGIVTTNTNWKFNVPAYPSIQFLQDIICCNDERLALVQIAPILNTSPKLVYYDNCRANLYAATKRQCTGTPPPSAAFLDKFEAFFNNVIMPEVTELLQDFHYSYEVWYNHLTAKQQADMDKVDTHNLLIRNVNIFCKSEKQMMDGNDYPKNRAISAMCDEHKYVMGPVIFALEQYFKKFKGYGGGKTWEQTGTLFKQWLDNGFTRISQSDISGMDRSVTNRLKEIGMAVYALISDKVTHIDPEVWAFHAYAKLTKINAKYYVDGTTESFGSVTMEGEVFSGSSDTTFLNSFITAVLNRYVYEIELHMTIDQYDLTAKGDDSAVASLPIVTPTEIRAAYKRVYYTAAAIKGTFTPLIASHGCGMVLKFLAISDHLDDIDYCSTNCFYCNTCQTFKITRKIDRFIHLTPWTDSIHNLPYNQRGAYLQNLHTSNLKWMDGLPIFTQLNNKLRTNSTTNYSLNGKPRAHKPLNKIDQIWFEKFFVKNVELNTYELQRQFGKNQAYSMIGHNTTINKCCVGEYYTWLENKLGLTSIDVNTICKEIENCITDKYQSDLLSTGFINHENYKASLLIEDVLTISN